MPKVCREDFVEVLSRAGLLEAAQLDDLGDLSRRIARPRELAQELIRRGWLTPFQANQLFLGRGDNLVLGQYVLLERLGEGGMGQVFKARQRNLNRLVALKVIRKEVLQSPNAIPRFEREIRALSQLSHPNIVHAFDADHVNGTYYFAMEFVDGIDLSRLVKQNGPLDVEQACDYIRQAALGLQNAHERGMVHRDIKPANLLVTNSFEVRGSGLNQRPGSGLVPRPGSGLLARPSKGQIERSSNGLAPKPNYPWGLVKLLDLGLAKWDEQHGPLATALTQLGSIMGTPDFIAPEQARDSRTSDIRADLYSLGGTLYFLLAGKIPFPDGTVTEKLMHHQFDEPEPVEQVRRRTLDSQAAGQHQLVRVPTPVKGLLRRLMAKRPEDRVQTPAELAEILGDLARRGAFQPGAADVSLGDETVLENKNPSASGSESLIVKVPRPARRPGRRAAMVAVGCLVALATVFGLSRLAGRSQPTEPTPPEKKAETVEEPAGKAWKRLQARSSELRDKPDELRNELLAFRQQFPADPRSASILASVARLPSLLDRVEDFRLMPKFQRFEWQPPELFAILGERFDKKSRAPLCIAFSPDGKYLATGNDDNVARLFDNALLPWPTRLAEHVNRVSCVAFSPDSRVLATGGRDGAVVFWDMRGRMLGRIEAHQEGTTALSFAPDGKTLASAGGDGQIKLWRDPLNGSKPHAWDSQAGRLLSLGFAPDGRTIVAGGTEGRLRWWSIADNAISLLGELALDTGWVRVALFSPDGKKLVCGGGGNGLLHLCDWDGKGVKSRTVLNQHEKPVNSVSFAPDGETFLSGSEDCTVRLWESATGKVAKEWPDLRFPVNSVAFAPDGRHAAFANGNSTVYLLRLARPAQVASTKQ